MVSSPTTQRTRYRHHYSPLARRRDRERQRTGPVVDAIARCDHNTHEGLRGQCAWCGLPLLDIQVLKHIRYEDQWDYIVEHELWKKYNPHPERVGIVKYGNTQRLPEPLDGKRKVAK